MKKYLIIIGMAILMFFVLPMKSVFAITLADKMNSDITPEKTYNTMVSPSYQKANSEEEQIDTQSGELILSQTDYSLPGRNGLDLNIGRIYKGQATNFWDSVSNVYIDDKWVQTNMRGVDTFYQDRYNLGVGWRLSFPTIQIKDNYDNTFSKYIHMENGAVYKLSAPTVVNGVNTYTIYSIKDVSVYESNEYNNGQSDGVSKYVMKDKNGKKTYFTDDGRIIGIVDRYGNRIKFEYSDLTCKVVGRQYEFTDTKRLISKITDSVNRVVTIDYTEGIKQNDGTYLVDDSKVDSLDFKININLPSGRHIIYNKGYQMIYCMNCNIGYLSTLESVSDDAKSKYRFNYCYFDQDDMFTFKKKEIDIPQNYQDLAYTAIGLSKIDYTRENKERNYRYGNFNGNDSRKVVEKTETNINSNVIVNKFSYAYIDTPNSQSKDYSYLKDAYRYSSETTDVNGNKIKYTYNGLHQLLTIDESGRNHKQTTAFTYDNNNLISKKETSMFDVTNGIVSTNNSKKIENYVYDDYGNLTSYTGPLAARNASGNPTNNEYTANYTYATDKYNILTSKTWKNDSNTTCRVEYEVASNGNITDERQIHNENGQAKTIATHYDYDNYGNLTKKTINNSSVTNYEYGIDADGADQKGAYLTKQYTTVNNKEVAKKYVYDFNTGNIEAEIDPNNNRKNIVYDDFNRPYYVQSADGKWKYYTYNDSEYEEQNSFSGALENKYRNREIRYIDNGNEFKYVYDLYGNLVEYYVNDVLSKKIEYDANSNKTKETDGNGNSTKYQYDSDNRLIKKSFLTKDGTEAKAETYSYNVGTDNNTALLVTKTNEEGYITKDHYDLSNRLVKEETTADKVNFYSSNYTYDYSNNKTSESDNKNSIKQYVYDDLNRLILEKDPLGNTKQYVYDANNKVIEEKNAKNVSTYYDYDVLGRLIRKRAPASDGTTATTCYIYDKVGNKIKEIAPNNYEASKDTQDLVNTIKGTSYTYDSMNRLLTTANPDGQVVEYRKYDANGNVAKIVDGIRYNGDIDSSKGKVFTYDAVGRVTQTVDALGNKETSQYDGVGNLVEKVDARGNKTDYSYNPDNTVAQVTYNDGSTVKYTYDKVGNKLTQVDQRGNTTTYEYSGYGKITKEYDPYNNVRNYKYDQNGNLIQDDNFGRGTTSYEYDANNQLKVKKTPLELDASNNTVYIIEQYNYNELGNITYKVITGTKDSTSKRETNLTYYNDGKVNTVTTNAGGYTKNYYDKNDNLTKIEELKDTNIYDVTKNIYDNNNRVLQNIHLVDEKDMYNAATLPNIVNLRDKDYSGKIQLITGYEYDILGNVIKAIDPRAYGYLDSDTTNRDKYTTVKTYDILNRLETVKNKANAAGAYKQYYYDASGNKIKERDEKGNIAAYTYDSLNRVTAIQDALGKTMTYAYDTAGNKITENNALNNSVNYTYDKLNRQTTVTDPYGVVISEKVYDANGNVIKAIDAKGYKSSTIDATRYGTVYTYNLANKLVKVVDPEIGALNDSTKFKNKYEYNQYGEKTKEIDALGNETKYDYNNAGKLIKVTDANNNVTQYTYDFKGNKLSVTDANNHTSYYKYGNDGIIISDTNADNNTITYQYDLALNKAKIVDRNGNTQLNTYDYRNLMLTKNVTNTSDNVSYSYDEIGNRIGMVDATGATTYAYNGNNWLTNVTKDGATQVSYTYNEVGNIISVKDKKGYTTNYEYDKASRMSKVIYTVAGVSRYTTYDYDDNGNRSMITYSCPESLHYNITENYTYDKNNKLLSVVNKVPWVISSYSYTYDLAGRQTSKTDSYGKTTYTYDNLGRVQQITAPGKTTVYSYDNVGNRIGQTETYASKQESEYWRYNGSLKLCYYVKNSNYTYTSANLLIALDEKMYDQSNDEYLDKQTGYIYDNNGNEKQQTTKASSILYRPLKPPANVQVIPKYGCDITTVNDYDGFNRLKKSTLTKSGNSTITDYAYNGDDLRVKKTVTKATGGTNNVDVTNYTYDRNRVILETDANDNVKVRYVIGINYIARIDKNEKLSYYLYNGHGDVVQTISAANWGVENQYDYDIFGNQTLVIEQYSNSIRFSGEFFDADGGLYYLSSRYYDPSIGRFITQDTFKGNEADPLSLNLYTYCKNDPVNMIDPTGHYPALTYDPNNYNDDVVTLQHELNSRYGYSLAEDGHFGPLTLSAVRDFQYYHKCAVDGMVGPQTWGAIYARGGPSTKPAPQATPTSAASTRHSTLTENPNEYNPEVVVLQQDLNAINPESSRIAEDGYFGGHTLDAVIAFQNSVGLDPDGSVGPLTWGKLDGNSSNKTGGNYNSGAYTYGYGKSISKYKFIPNTTITAGYSESGWDKFKKIFEVEAGAGAGLGASVNAFGIVNAQIGGYIDPFDFAYANGQASFGKKIDGGLEIELLKVGHGIKLGGEYLVTNDKNDTFYGIGDDPNSQIEWDYGLKVGNKSILGASSSGNTDYKITLGASVEVGVGGQAEIRINLTKAKEFVDFLMGN